MQVLCALDHLHCQYIIHTDVKPVCPVWINDHILACGCRAVVIIRSIIAIFADLFVADADAYCQDGFDEYKHSNASEGTL